MDVYIRGKRVRVSPSASIGKGGEADVFDLGGGVALKLFKRPDHPDLAGDAAAREGARARLAAHQRKLPAFPGALPARVVAPADLATDRGGQILGYTMSLVAGAEVLLRFADPAYRAASVDPAALGPLLADLHRTVEGLHARGVVIGDLNDLNILVRGSEAHLIDADSFQLAGFPCGVYTERFLDPLIADPAAPRPVPARPFNPASDWYAFAAIAMQTLLCAGPHGGVYRPKSASARVPHDARPLHRITVFHPEVVYPRPAIPVIALPDDLVHAFVRTFVEDDRRPVPRALLESLTWSRCPLCDLPHARAACPRCVKAPRPAEPVATAKGPVSRHLVRATRGRIVAAAVQAGVLRYLVHEDGALVREDGRRILEGDLHPGFHVHLLGSSTVISSGSDVAVLGEGGGVTRFTADGGGRDALATNSAHCFRVDGGCLLRRSPGGAGLLGGQDVRFGDVLPGQTRIWAGERLGFGLYRAGSLSVAFTFETDRPGLTDTVRLPYPSGQVLAHEVLFGQDHIWVLFAARDGARTVHVAARIRPDGALEATARAPAWDGSWLGGLGGKCAVGRALLAATDAGIVRVEERGGELVEVRRHEGTEPFVTSATALHAGPDGLYAVDTQAIWRLRTT